MYLGLDLGASRLRASLVDGDGRVIGTAKARYPLDAPRPGWCEQDPDSWIFACKGCIAALRRDNAAAFAALRGIGLAGQMHGAVLLGEAATPLRPCILGNDRRAVAEAALLDVLPETRRLFGNIMFPGFTAPTLMWLRAHEPEIWAQIRTVLMPKDYLRLWLTGERITDLSDASGTGWLDVAARRWSEPLLQAGGIAPDQVPPLVEGTAPAGQLRQDLAEEWDLDHPVPVSGGAAENAADACAVGAIGAARGLVELRRTGVILAARDRFAPAPETAVHSFCHALPERWLQMGVVLSATACLDWLGEITYTKPRKLVGALPETISGPGPVLFLPYLAGERTPHHDARLRGGFAGLERAQGRSDLTRAVIEGVSFALADALSALQASGARPERLIAQGGGTRAPFWLETLATVLDLPLEVPESGHSGPALGAARLAMVAATGADPAQVMTPPPLARVVEPRADLTDLYRSAQARFRAGHPAFKALG